MAAGKKSFVLYSDQKELFESLPDEQAGKLIKHIFKYVNDENPQGEDALVNLAFISVKASLKRDLKKWEKQLAQRSAAGKASAEKRRQALTESNENQRALDSVHETQRNSTDSVSVSVSVNDNDINNKPQTPKGDDFNIHCERFVKYVGEQTGRKFKTLNDKNKRKLQSTIKQYSWEQIRDAVYYATQNKFHKDNNYQYLTPEFFTRPETIDKYAFPSEKQKEYTGENAHLLNHVDKYLNAVKS
jgi:hypothetical protein